MSRSAGERLAEFQKWLKKDGKAQHGQYKLKLATETILNNKI